MRADRLISVLLLLQRHDQVTVQQVADELEISPRTARRDLEALMTAGVPVYSIAGRGGGWKLIGGASTDLSGLNEGEAKALFLAIGSTTDPQTAQALRKLGQALPASFRDAAATLADRSITDPRSWRQSRRAPEIDKPRHPSALRIVADALAANRELEFTYLKPRTGGSERVAQPLGIIHKAGRWYLMAETSGGRRSFRVDRIEDPIITDREFESSAGFDLEDAWAESLERFAKTETALTAKGRVLAPQAWDHLRHSFGGRLRADSPGVGDHFEVSGYSVEELSRMLIAFGDTVEIDSPAELRIRLIDLATAILARYNS